MEPDQKVKILDALFESGNAIDEGISFEARFSRKSHPAIQEDIAGLEILLSKIYLKALDIASDIQQTFRSSHDSRSQ